MEFFGFYDEQAILCNGDLTTASILNYFISMFKMSFDSEMYTHEGVTAVKFSYSRVQKRFKFLTRDIIRHSLDKLEHAGILKSYHTQGQKYKTFTMRDDIFSKYVKPRAPKHNGEIVGEIPMKANAAENLTGKSTSEENSHWETSQRENDFSLGNFPPINNTNTNINNNKNKEERESMPLSGPSPSDVFSTYDRVLKDTALPQVRENSLNAKRRDACNKLSKKFFPTIEQWEEYFEIIAESDFLNGNNERCWVPGIDFILKEANVIKILEGAYKNRIKLPPVVCRNQGLARILGVKV